MSSEIENLLQSAGFSSEEIEKDSRIVSLKRLLMSRIATSAEGQLHSHFPHIIESISGPIIVFDSKFQYLSVNNYFLTLLGHTSPEKVIGKRAGSFEIDSFLIPVFKGLVSTNQSSFKWEANISAGSKSAWYIFSALKVGEIEPQFIVSGFEVSNLKMQQALLMDREERYKAAFQNVAVGICQLDYGFLIENFNDTFLEILGLSKLDVQGREFSSILNGKPGIAIMDQLKRLRDAEAEGKNSQLRLEIEYRVNAPDRYLDLWFEISIKKLYGRTGDIFFVLTLKDVTELKKAFLELEHSQSALMYNEKMAALGEMAGGLAHEINNPLAIITGRTQLMRDRLSNYQNWSSKDVGLMEKFTESIQKTCGRISKIVSGLKVFSASENALHMKPHEICLNDLIENAYTLCVERFKNANIELRIEIESKSKFFVMGLRDQLTQVIFNLLNNSFDSVKENENAWVLIRLSGGEGQTSRVSIKDSGKGIPKEILNKIFQPLFTTKKVGHGTGLGLSISKGIIESHGGRLLVDAMAENTLFIIELPRVEAEAQTKKSSINKSA